MKQYLRNILISLDQFANTLANGNPDETISSRLGKYVESGRGWIPCQLCKLLGFIFKDKDHCLNNIERDEL